MALRKDNSFVSEDVSILSSGVKIEGKISSEGNVRIDGRVIGDVNINGNLTLGEGAEIKGEVKAKSLVVSGKVEGTIDVAEKLTLEPKSFVKGDIITKILVIEEGAVFDGKSVMSNKPSFSTGLKIGNEKGKTE
ncbi:polymer-forming cytoskeletal [bacterium BMS3Abin04]|nr:polymer-forming cytoskeletal [bacterium BMS3Abin04]